MIFCSSISRSSINRFVLGVFLGDKQFMMRSCCLLLIGDFKTKLDNLWLFGTDVSSCNFDDLDVSS